MWMHFSANHYWHYLLQDLPKQTRDPCANAPTHPGKVSSNRMPKLPAGS